MSNVSFSSSTPHGLPARPLHLVPAGAVSVGWEACALADVRLLTELYGPSDGGSPLASGGAHLRVALAVISDPDHGARAVVVANGEIDIATAWPLQSASLAVAGAVVAPLQRAGVIPVLLDWQGVTFLDCSSLYLLRDLSAAGVDRGWSLRWIPPAAPGPLRLLRFAAGQGWLPEPFVQQLPAQSSPARPSSLEMSG